MEEKKFKVDLELGIKHRNFDKIWQIITAICLILLEILKSIGKSIGRFFKRIWKWLVAVIIFFSLVFICIFVIHDYIHNKAVANLESKLSNFENTDYIYNLSIKVLSDNELSMDGEVAVSTDKFTEKALANLNQLAENGHSGAQFVLGLYYGGSFKRGGCVFSRDRDDSKSAYWYLQAAIQGNSAAMNNLGVNYLHGEGVTCNKAKALYWFRKSFEYGGNYGAMNLGDCFRDGVVIYEDYHYKTVLVANIDSARYYWNIAVHRGCTAAKDRLQKIYD